MAIDLDGHEEATQLEVLIRWQWSSKPTDGRSHSEGRQKDETGSSLVSLNLRYAFSKTATALLWTRIANDLEYNHGLPLTNRVKFKGEKESDISFLLFFLCVSYFRVEVRIRGHHSLVSIFALAKLHLLRFERKVFRAILSSIIMNCRGLIV
jgi:hypothetical protein